MSSLVERLRIEQRIVASLRPQPGAEALKAAIERGLVHIKFTETRGGTELSIELDRSATDLTGADFTQGEGVVCLCGTLVLDYVPVCFQGVLDLRTLEGRGRLEPVESEKSRLAVADGGVESD
jgi:hypothetical protein